MSVGYEGLWCRTLFDCPDIAANPLDILHSSPGAVFFSLRSESHSAISTNNPAPSANCLLIQPLDPACSPSTNLILLSCRFCLQQCSWRDHIVFFFPHSRSYSLTPLSLAPPLESLCVLLFSAEWDCSLAFLWTPRKLVPDSLHPIPGLHQA